MNFMNKFKSVDKNIGKDIALLLSSVISLAIVYSVWSYLNLHQENLLEGIQFMKKDIKEKSDEINALNNSIEYIRKIFQHGTPGKAASKRMSKKRLGDMLKSLGHKHQFLHLYFSFIPGDETYKDKTFVMSKHTVKIQFSAKNDLVVYRFLKDLMRKFPGIIHSKEIKMKKEKLSMADAQFFGVEYVIRGVYNFEWYDVCSANIK